MIRGIELDHVALATERPEDGYARYARELGGRWGHGGDTNGFTSYQVVYANDMRVEIISPFDVQVNDFMRRFLDRNGPGPHHLTFKVNDLQAALEQVRRAGYEPVGVQLGNPHWQEAFLHPKDAPGVVIQLAHSDHTAEEHISEGGSDWFSPEPANFPAPKAATATLVHVAHAVADLDGAVELFAGLLGGMEDGRGEQGGVRWIDLVWPGPGRVRLLSPGPAETPAAAAVVEWLGDRSGRVHHLAFAGIAVGDVDPVVTIEPAANLGTRLLLASQAESFASRPIG